MTRKLLIEAVEAAARECGFAFRTGFGYRLASEVGQLPAAWLETPHLEKTEGRAEGVKYYSLKINLLDRCAGHSADDREACWGELEERAARLLQLIGGARCVRAVTQAAFTPAEYSLTAGGELSLAMTFGVQMPFCTRCGE
jgi:hypothetical protein